jgi:polygalacturonase
MTTLVPKFEQTGSSVNRTMTSKFQDTVSVKDFGATGDGTTNDTTAITLGITLATLNSIQVYASAATALTFQAFGSEIS